METNKKSLEIDYYLEILAIYVESKKINELYYLAENWIMRTYVSLMRDLYQNKEILDSNIENVVKNSIILMINLFNRYRKLDNNNSMNKLTNEDKKFVFDSFSKFLE